MARRAGATTWQSFSNKKAASQGIRQILLRDKTDHLFFTNDDRPGRPGGLVPGLQRSPDVVGFQPLDRGASAQLPEVGKVA